MSRPPAISLVRVRYAETDKMGVVYYANYFVWFEVGRTDLPIGVDMPSVVVAGVILLAV